MRQPHVGTCIFCDDIRYEIGGKLSLMGLYAADMILAQPAPLMLPKFACVVLIITDIDDLPKQIAIKVTVPTDKPEGVEIANLNIAPELSEQNREGAVKSVFRAILPMVGIPLTHEGYIEVWADTGREQFRCGRLRVVFNAQAPSEAVVPVS